MLLLTLLMQTVVVTHKVEITITTDTGPHKSVAQINAEMKRNEAAFLKSNPQLNFCRHFAGQTDDPDCHNSYLYLSMYNPTYLKQHPEIRPVADADWSVSGQPDPNFREPSILEKEHMAMERDQSPGQAKRDAEIQAKLDAEMKQESDKITRCGYNPDCQ